MHVGQHNLCPRPNLYAVMHSRVAVGVAQRCLKDQDNLLRSVVGYGNVAVNRQQHSYNYSGLR